MNSLFCNKEQNFQKNVKLNKCRVQSRVCWTWELRSTCSKGLEVPYQNTFKEKPAFFKRLIKVLVDKNLFLVHSSSCSNKTYYKPLQGPTFHLWIYYNPCSNLTQEIQFLEFMGGSNKWVGTITGLDYWTGLLDYWTGLLDSSKLQNTPHSVQNRS